MVSITGWAATRFGRKQLFVFSMVGNTIATVMCGAAGSLEAEVFWRFIQGLASGPLLAIGQSLVISAFPQEKTWFCHRSLGCGRGRGSGVCAGARWLSDRVRELALDLLCGHPARHSRRHLHCCLCPAFGAESRP